MTQAQRHADIILNNPEYLAGALILALGQWKDGGCQDPQLERVAAEYLERLQLILKTDREGAVNYVLGFEKQVA